MTAELIHRLHFAFTVTFHYLFPQLTMGLALLIVVIKSVALKTGTEQCERAGRFWGRIFGINSVFGVVTGIPMEFEFGTNWACFSQPSGGVIGQPLAIFYGAALANVLCGVPLQADGYFFLPLWTNWQSGEAPGIFN